MQSGRGFSPLAPDITGCHTRALVRNDSGADRIYGRLVTDNTSRVLVRDRVMSTDELYFGDVLQSYQNGVQFDLRVKLAIEFLKAPGFLSAMAGEDPIRPVREALEIATELLAEAQKRGLLRPLPAHDELPAYVKAHLRRTARAHVYTQVQGHKIGQEESGVVQRANGLIPP